MKMNKYIKIVSNLKFRFIRRSFGAKKFKLLDVGAGNHSASRITELFPNCEYYGLDLNKEYNNDPKDFEIMKDFYELDLTKLEYSIIPDEYFDGIWMAHVVEHLFNGDFVIEGLIRKLKPGGYMYVEYPGQKSTRLPSMYGTLNFYDDTSHVRIYSVGELTKLFQDCGCRVIEGKIRRNWYYLLAMPFRIVQFTLKGKRLIGNIFWDLLGFAEYVYARKDISR
jgi:SAM-dependent methyltransferase